METRRPHPDLEWMHLELGDLPTAWLIVENHVHGTGDYTSIHRRVNQARQVATHRTSTREAVPA